MYVVYRPDTRTQTGYSRITPALLSTYLKETFPEIADATTLSQSLPGRTIRFEDVNIPALIIGVDSSFVRMFDIQILEGNREFLTPGSKKFAITREKALQLFGNENPIGKTVFLPAGPSTICAIVSRMSKQSSFVFDIVAHKGVYAEANWNYRATIPGYTIIELFPGTNLEAFEKKLYEHDTGETRGNINKMKITPLKKMRYVDPDIEREVKFGHIVIFAMCGILVIVCALFNYLSLFMSRFRMRQKELALRKVCGASGGSLLTMLSIEFLITLLISVVFGFTLMQWMLCPFLSLSEIQMDLPVIYWELLLYIGGIILIFMPVFWIILLVFRMRTLNASIHRGYKNVSRKISIIAQLVISIGFSFSAIIVMKQINFLHHTNELGFSFRNSGSIIAYDIPDGNTEGLANQLKQIPEIVEVTDVLAQNAYNLIPVESIKNLRVYSWDDKLVDAEDIDIWECRVTPDIIDFFKFQLVSGEMLTESDPESLVLLNESAIKKFGWLNPVGKQFNNYTVKGVIKNVYNSAPTIPAKPMFYAKHIPPPQLAPSPTASNSGTVRFASIAMFRSVMFKYEEGLWESCKEKIEQLIAKDPNLSRQTTIYHTEEEYNKYLKSERALIKLLSFVSAICILICVFGFVSLVSLTCEERRKSIAIRKINGATVKDILAIFANEYTLLLFTGAAIAFPASYTIMQRWLEQYVKQTDIPAWIYLSILGTMAFVIVLCVGWQVYKTSVENPAEVIKSE